MMRQKFALALCVIFFIVPITGLAGNLSKHKPTSSSFGGQTTVGGTVLYLEPTATDGDFEYGTVVGPVFAARQVTNAHMQLFKPDFQDAFEFNYDYQFANSLYDIGANYFYYSQDLNRNTNTSLNPFIQSFLGGAFTNAQASYDESINYATVKFGKTYILPHNVMFHPHIGLSYLSVNRDFNARFKNFLFTPQTPANLTGNQRSDFQGGGISLGFNFNYQIVHHFHFVGAFGTGFLLGHLRSKLNANFMLGAANTPYNATFRNNTRFVLALDERLGVNYQFNLSKNSLLSFEVGYFANDFIDSVERVAPLNGFARNPGGSNPPSTHNSASLGANGPYAKLSLMFQPNNNLSDDGVISLMSKNLASNAPGLFVKIMNSAAKPIPENADTTYAFLNSGNALVKTEQVEPNYGWNGKITLGYLFKSNNTDLAISYSHLEARGSDSIAPGAGQSLLSTNSSGMATTTFSQANANIQYVLDRINLIAGQNFAIDNNYNLHVFTGVDYAYIKRTQKNSYLAGGVSDVDKFPVLVSRFSGAGPLFGTDFTGLFQNHFGFISHLSTSLLFGTITSTLNQRNFYRFGVKTSNRLTTGSMKAMVATADAKIGLLYRLNFGNHYQVDFEAGYQGQFYFKAINLVFPVFLTGLEQKNTNLGVIGPYLTVSVRGV